jgi:hypothetical protein
MIAHPLDFHSNAVRAIFACDGDEGRRSVVIVFDDSRIWLVRFSEDEGMP